MNKHFLILFLLFVLGSCASDDQAPIQNIQDENKSEQKNTFAIFSKPTNIQGRSSQNTIDYAEGFSILMQRYDSIHNTNISGLVNTANIVQHSKRSAENIIVLNKDFYIETRLHSQTIFEDNEDIWVMFPKIKDNQVEDLLIASYTEKGTKVLFSYVKKDSELFKVNRDVFQKEFDRLINTNSQIKNRSLGCGNPGEDDCQLGEVIITPRPKPCSLCHTTPPENPNHECPAFAECLAPPSEAGGGDGGQLPKTFVMS